MPSCPLQISLAGRVVLRNMWCSRAPTSGLGKLSGDFPLATLKFVTHQSFAFLLGQSLCCNDVVLVKADSNEHRGYWAPFNYVLSYVISPTMSMMCLLASLVNILVLLLDTVRCQPYRYPHLQLTGIPAYAPLPILNAEGTMLVTDVKPRSGQNQPS